MAPDERERNFDKALGRHLRSTAASGRSASTPADSAAHSAACLDPETLAAYHERSLLPEQMNSCKEHIVGCAHCQTILSHLETTDELALQASEQNEVLAANESVPALTARSLEPIPRAAAPKKSRRAFLLRGARWQWLAPAGAIAAGLLVYIALHENQPLPLPKSDGLKMASQQPLPPTSPSISGAVSESSPAYAVRAPRQSAADQLTASNGRAAAEARKPSAELSDQSSLSVPKTPADKESALRKDTERDRTADLLQAESKLDRDAKSAPLAKQESADQQLRAQMQAVEVQAQNQNVQNIQNAPATPGPAPIGQAQPETKKMKAARAASAPAPPPQAGTGGAVASYGDTASTELMAVVSNPRLIAPPASGLLWRAGRAGVIDFSRDAGSSWSRQSSGVLVDLVAGSAPSDNVCWIVGRLGTVLLTTDGGVHWKLLSSPTKDDIGGIQASDALHARIWNSRNTKIFETSDGGLTWKNP